MLGKSMYLHIAVLFVAAAFPVVEKVNHEDEPTSQDGRKAKMERRRDVAGMAFLHNNFNPSVMKAILAKRIRTEKKTKTASKHGIRNLVSFRNNSNSDRLVDVSADDNFDDAPMDPYLDDAVQTGCERVFGFKYSGIVSVQSCPKSFQNFKIRELCTSRTTNENGRNGYDLEVLPVESEDGIVYKNRYCAICNNASNPKHWNINFICEAPTSLLFQTDFSSAKVLEEYQNTSTCDVQISPPYDKAIEACNVRAKRRIPRKLRQGKGDVYPISFSLLMNFGFDGKTHVMFSTNDEITESKGQSRCKENEIFDSDRNKCRRVSCSSGYSLMEDETCVKDASAIIYNDTDIQNIKNVDSLTNNNRVALVALEVNVTYDDLGFVLYAIEFKPIIIKKLADLLNINSERIQNFSIQFLNQSQFSGQNIRVETMPKDEFEKQIQNVEVEDFYTNDDELFLDSASTSDQPNENASESTIVTNDLNVTDFEPSTNTATAAKVVHKEHVILNPQILQLSFILLPSHVDRTKESVADIISRMNTLKEQNSFKFDMNGTTFNIVHVDEKDPEREKTFCKFGVMDMYFNDAFEMVKEVKEDGNSPVTGVYIPSSNSMYAPGEYDLTLLVKGNIGLNSNLTGVAGYVFVCINPRIVNRNCAQIKISSEEYKLFENKSILFNHETYNMTQYDVLDEQRGDLEICVPDEYYKNEIRHRHHHMIQSCHDGFLEFTQAEGYITAIIGRLSIVALCFVLVTYWLFRTLRNLPGINTMNLTLALLIGETMFIEGESSAIPWVCSLVAISVHYFFLASFFWMNVMSYDVYKTFANKCILTRIRGTKKFLPRYAMYAWGSPALIVAVCVFIEYGNMFGSFQIGYGHNTDTVTGSDNVTSNDTNGTSDVDHHSGCWITRPVAALIAFGLPIMVIFVINTVFFIRTIICIQATAKLAHHTTRRTFSHMTGKSDVMLYVRMSTVMGFTWIFGLASSIISSIFTKPDQTVCMSLRVLSILFTVFNCGQGLFIFFAFVFKRRVFYLYKGLFKRIKTSIAKGKFQKLNSASSNTISTVTSQM